MNEKIIFVEREPFEYPLLPDHLNLIRQLEENPSGGVIIFGFASEKDELIRQYRKSLYPETLSQARINAISIMVSRGSLRHVNLPEEEQWRVHEALMRTAVYGPDILPGYYHAVNEYLGHGPIWRVFDLDSEYPTNSNFNKVIRESIFANSRSLNLRTNFSRWTYAMKSTRSDTFWYFERFIRQINKPLSGGRTQEDFRYKRFTPVDKLKPGDALDTYTINDFPGSGILIRGLHGKLFPPGHIEARFTPASYFNSSAEQIANIYNQYLVSGEEHLKNTNFVFARGFVIVDNPRMMKIKGEEYSLIAFNDHFSNSTQRPAYLIPRKYTQEFLSDPLREVGDDYIFNPITFEERFKGEAIKINSLDTLSGMCFGVPNESLMNFLVEDYCASSQSGEVSPEFLLSMHEDVLNAQLFGFAQIDLLNEANRLYNLGYQYDTNNGYWTQDEFRMLKEMVRWNAAVPTPGEGPVLFPYPSLSHSIDPLMVKKCGFLDSSLLLYRNNPSGDFLFFDGVPPNIGAEVLEVKDPSKWQNALGNEGLRKWRSFLETAGVEQANLAVTSPLNLRTGKQVLELGG